MFHKSDNIRLYSFRLGRHDTGKFRYANGQILMATFSQAKESKNSPAKNKSGEISLKHINNS